MMTMTMTMTTANDVNVDIVLADEPSDITPIIPSPPPSSAATTTAPHDSINDDDGLAIALDRAERGRAQGGIPIGAALFLTSTGDCLGSGHNMRVQRRSPTLHAEMAALEDAGRLSAAVYRDCTLVGVSSFLIKNIRVYFNQICMCVCATIVIAVHSPRCGPIPQCYVLFFFWFRAWGTSCSTRPSGEFFYYAPSSSFFFLGLDFFSNEKPM